MLTGSQVDSIYHDRQVEIQIFDEKIKIFQGTKKSRLKNYS